MQNSSKDKINEMAERLESASLGLEHIFREFGQMFEAVDNHLLTHKHELVRISAKQLYNFRMW